MGLASVLAPIDHDVSRPESFTSAGHIQPGSTFDFAGPTGAW
jgi:hypothetical protein